MTTPDPKRTLRSTEQGCVMCTRTVYPNGEGVWYSVDGRAMCPSCAADYITLNDGRRWDSERGCWVVGEEES